MKSLARQIITKILWNQVAQLRRRHNLTIIGVVGSMGKTSTKFAVAQVLGSARNVQWQKGNYNHLSIVPLVFFGHTIPPLFNPLAWLVVILNNQRQIKHYPYDTVVIELGTDGPGQLLEFKDYIELDVAIVTAVAPEHMEFFADMDEVAEEELSVATFSKRLIINADLVEQKYYKEIKNSIVTYGTDKADVIIRNDTTLELQKAKKRWLQLGVARSKAEAYSKTAAAIAADMLQLDREEIERSIADLRPVPGRMQLLVGINSSTIIDDTYNASPDATIAALEFLYSQKAPQRIAMLGNMNELGAYAKEEHERVGKYCSPKKLAYVITVGPEANKYLAPIARNRGCNVRTFESPYQAGDFVRSIMQKGSVVLAKGSQNNVYMEEALKVLLVEPSDTQKLVRQSTDWIKRKQANFKI